MPVRVQGPDGNTYVMPDGTDKATAVAYFKRKGIGASTPSADDVVRAAGISPLPAHANAPRELSGRPGDSTDLRVNLFGNDGSQMLKVPAQHAADAVMGLATAATHPLKTAKAVLYDQPVASLKRAQEAYDTHQGAGEVIKRVAQAAPVVGPWATQVLNDADNYGVVPAALGLGVDALAPKVIGKAGEVALKGVGTAARAVGATPESLKLAATRALVPGATGDILNRALKPGVQYGSGTSDLFEKTLGPTLATGARINGVKALSEAVDAARDANASRYNDLIAPYRKPRAVPVEDGAELVQPERTSSSEYMITPPPEALSARAVEGPFRPSAVDGTPIAKAQQGSIPLMERFEQPAIPGKPGSGIVAQTRDTSNLYKRNFDIPTLDALRVDANRKLNAFYAKDGGDKFAALANPETARIKAVGDSIRNELYSTLEANASLPEGSVGEHQRMYGNLSTLGDIAGKRDIVYGRHDPISLAEKVAASHGGPVATIFNAGKERLLRGLTDSDALVRSAIDRYQNPNGTPLQTAPLPARLGSAATVSADTLKRLRPYLPVVSRAGQETTY